MPDRANSLAWVGDALDDLGAQDLRRHPTHRDSPPGRLVDGLVNLSSNDYLGLAGDPRLGSAAGEAARRWGVGAGASRLITGGTRLHRALERRIAEWKGAEDAVVFSSGYLANLGAVTALVGRGDTVLSDALNHASIVDACRLSRAEVAVYPHGDVEAVDDRLRGARGRCLVITDGVFSMDGDTADLCALAEVCERHGATLVVDDAHGGGVLGPDGRGTAAALGCADAVDVTVGTLSKSFGASGGYVAAGRDVCEWLRNAARGFVFDTALPPPVAAAALTAIDVAVAEPWRRHHARHLAGKLAAGLGVDAPAACIVPLVVGSPTATMTLAAGLAAQGFRVVGIRPPTVAAGTSRLRFATTADLTEQDVDAVVAAVRDLR